ncbi:uncharacterized protein LOC122615710 isoform X6 [Drosophila teissieri]|uniref:uncharacterized protein LOC122615710 isoform X6 n=1 Tax=Drosophila teissieri TaxID=7243 RepID=UPI001CBA3589|nr:uncharacterized protein LOC122615710 isoform X6 [Drosophila teissieri]
MWRAEKFCFCLKLRIGCTIIAFFTLFLCAVHLVEFYRLKDPYSSGQPSGKKTGLTFFGEFSICWLPCVYLTLCYWGLPYQFGVT